MSDPYAEYQKRALSSIDADVTVPPGYEVAALNEFVDGEAGTWRDLVNTTERMILRSLPDDQGRLGALQNREQNLAGDLKDLEEERERSEKELVDKIRRTVRSRFPGASETKQDALVIWITDSPWSFADKLTPPELWEESDEEDRNLWKQFKKKLQNVRESTRYERFQLSIVRRLKQKAQKGALLPCTESETSDPKRKAEAVFASRSRPEGSNTNADGEVKQWAVESFRDFFPELSSEQAKKRVVRIASQHDYHFTKRTLERWIKG